MSKVTVYILNYNYGRYLSKAIKSVLSQTYKDIEVLVIDDGSTDNSGEILKGFSSQVTVIRQQNMGLVKSIIKAFTIAKGDYVVRLDADDWLEETCIEKLVNKIETSNNTALVFPDYFEVDEFGNILRQIKRHEFSDNVTMLDKPAHGACTLIKKECYFNVGGHNETLKCQDGVDIWLSLTEKYDVLNVNEPLFYYRKHPQSLTTDENRILSTKGSIYKNHAKRRGFAKEKTYAFIPVRSQLLDGEEYALMRLGNETIVEWGVKKAKKSELVSKIIILVDNPDLASDISKIFQNEPMVDISLRDKKFSSPGTSINQSVENYFENNTEQEPKNIVVLTLDYPFSRHNYIDSAIYSMFLFDSISVDTVMMDNSIFYYHDGTGLKPWVDTFVRNERDDIYIRRGGVSVFRKDLLGNKLNSISEKMGHVIVDKISSFEIRSQEDLEVANFIAQTIISEDN